MAVQDSDQANEERIAHWREYLRRRQAIHGVDVEELEAHLRDQIDILGAAGLSQDEAFLVAVKRLGDLDELSREVSTEYSERLWKQLVVGGDDPTRSFARPQAETWVALGLATVAGVAIKIPEWLAEVQDFRVVWFQVRNYVLLVLPLLAAYFAWKRRMEPAQLGWLLPPFIAAAAVVNLYPFTMEGNTQILASLHLPIVLWLLVGVVYAGGDWRNLKRRMDFVRFSGEWFIYYTLIALGGGVLMGVTMLMFSALGLDAEWVLASWLIPCGSIGAVIISAWLVEAKQSVVENMAPVLTRIFTPLFAAVLFIFLGTMAWTGNAIDTEREVLIGFDLLLVLVLGLLLYAISARDPQAPPGLFDRIQFTLVAGALLVDVLALIAIAGRISEFGFSPNKVAALGENLILLVNLGGSAILYLRFLQGRDSFHALERWQTRYIPVYAVWAAVVVVVFPPLFGYI